MAPASRAVPSFLGAMMIVLFVYFFGVFCCMNVIVGCIFFLWFSVCVFLLSVISIG